MRRALLLVVLVPLLAACGDDEAPSSSPDTPPASEPTSAAPFRDGACREIGLDALARDWEMAPTAPDLETVEVASTGPTYSCTATWRDPDQPLRQARVALAVRTYDDASLARSVWDDVRERSQDPASVAGGLDVAKVPTSPPSGPWDEALALAAARLLAGGGTDEVGEREQVFVKVWVREGSTLADVTVTYEVPEDTESRSVSVGSMQGVAHDVLVSAL